MNILLFLKISLKILQSVKSPKEKHNIVILYTKILIMFIIGIVKHIISYIVHN